MRIRPTQSQPQGRHLLKPRRAKARMAVHDDDRRAADRHTHAVQLSQIYARCDKAASPSFSTYAPLHTRLIEPKVGSRPPMTPATENAGPVSLSIQVKYVNTRELLEQHRAGAHPNEQFGHKSG